jgi:hypothetical protein
MPGGKKKGGGKPAASQPSSSGVAISRDGKTVTISTKQQPKPKAKVEKKQQAKPQQAKPQQARPQQAKPQQARPQQAKPQQAKPLQAKPQQPKPLQAKPLQAKPLQAKPQQPQPAQPAASAAASDGAKQREADEAARRRRLERFGSVPRATTAPQPSSAKATPALAAAAAAAVTAKKVTPAPAAVTAAKKRAAGPPEKEPEPAKRAKSGKACHICGEVGHFKRDCPRLQAPPGGTAKAGSKGSQAKGLAAPGASGAGSKAATADKLEALRGKFFESAKQDVPPAQQPQNATNKPGQPTRATKGKPAAAATAAVAAAPAQQQQRNSKKRSREDSDESLLELTVGYAAARAKRLAAMELSKKQELANRQKLDAQRAEAGTSGGVGRAKSKVVVLPKLPPVKPKPGVAAATPAAKPTAPSPAAADKPAAPIPAAATPAEPPATPAPATTVMTTPAPKPEAGAGPNTSEDTATLEHKCAKYRAKLSAKRADGSGLELPIASPKRKEYEGKLQQWEKMLAEHNRRVQRHEQRQAAAAQPAVSKDTKEAAVDGGGERPEGTPNELKPGYIETLKPLPISLTDDAKQSPGKAASTAAAGGAAPPVSEPDLSAKATTTGLGFNETGGFQKKTLTKTQGGQSLQVEVFMRMPTAPLTARGQKVQEMRRLQPLFPAMQRLAFAGLLLQQEPTESTGNRGSCLRVARRGVGVVGTILDLVVEHLASSNGANLSIPMLQRSYVQGWPWPVPDCKAHPEVAPKRPAAAAAAGSSVAVVRKRVAPAASPPKPETQQQQPRADIAPTRQLQVIRVRFDGAGALGLNFRRESIPPVLNSIKEGSLAAAQAPPLRPGLVLSKVAGRSVLVGGGKRKLEAAAVATDEQTQQGAAAAAAAAGGGGATAEETASSDTQKTGGRGRSTRSAPGKLLGTLSSVQAEAKLSEDDTTETETVGAGAGNEPLPLSYSECIALIKAASRPLEMEFRVPDDSPRPRFEPAKAKAKAASGAAGAAAGASPGRWKRRRK